MKKICFIVLALFCLTFSNNLVHAGSITKAGGLMGGYTYQDLGGIYTNMTVPIDVANDDNIKSTPDLSKLRVGEAAATNIFWLVEIGDAGIDTAARKAGITKIQYVDTKIQKIFIPLIFIPIYVNTVTTIVYGE